MAPLIRGTAEKLGGECYVGKQKKLRFNLLDEIYALINRNKQISALFLAI